MSVFLDELHAVRHEHRRHLRELPLLLSMEQVVINSVGQLLQDGVEDSVVEGQVAVGVTEDQPASQGGVCAGQLALDRVLSQDEN